MGDIVKPVGQWIADNLPLSVGIGISMLSFDQYYFPLESARAAEEMETCFMAI